LQALNLKGFLVSDGKNPINLFNTANGMIGNDVIQHAVTQSNNYNNNNYNNKSQPLALPVQQQVP